MGASPERKILRCFEETPPANSVPSVLISFLWFFCGKKTNNFEGKFIFRLFNILAI